VLIKYKKHGSKKWRIKIDNGGSKRAIDIERGKKWWHNYVGHDH